MGNNHQTPGHDQGGQKNPNPQEPKRHGGQGDAAREPQRQGGGQNDPNREPQRQHGGNDMGGGRHPKSDQNR